MKLLLLSLVAFLFSQPSATTVFGEIIANYSDLPYVTNAGPFSPDKTLTPSLKWLDDHCSGKTSRNCPFGWIDLMGFDQMVRINGVDYINVSAADAAIVQYETFIRINDRHYLKKWKNDLQKEVSGDIFLVKLDSKAVLCISQDNSESCYNEYLILTDSEPAPKHLTNDLFPNASLTFYNNSRGGKAIILLDRTPFTISETYVYKNQSITHITKMGLVRSNSKGVKYVELFPADIWKNSNSSLFSHLNESVIIADPFFDPTKLTIIAEYPFSQAAINGKTLNMTEKRFSPYTAFHPVFFFLLALILIPLIVLKNIIKRLKI